MDNILIHTRRRDGEMEEEHVKQHHDYTHHILQKLEENDLYLKPKKCAFEQKEVNYLGVIVGNNMVKMDPGKLQGVADYAVPTTPTEI